MKNLFLSFFLFLAITTSYASTNVPYFLRPHHSKTPALFSTWSLDYTLQNMTTHYPTYNWTAMPYIPNSTGNGGSLIYTDDYGTSMDMTWSISGTTLSWSVNVVPGSDVNMGIHTFFINDTATQQDIVLEANEEPGEYGYGNVTWSKCGTVEVSADTDQLFISFENYTAFFSAPGYSNSAFQVTFSKH